MSDLCPVEEEKIFTIWPIWPHSCTKSPAPWVTKLTILIEALLFMITIHIHLIWYLTEKKINFTVKIKTLSGGIHEIYNFQSCFPTDAKNKILSRLASIGLFREKLSTDKTFPMTYNDIPKPFIAISAIGDLKRSLHYTSFRKPNAVEKKN